MKFLRDLFTTDGNFSLSRICFFLVFVVVYKSLILNELIENPSVVITLITVLAGYLFSSKTRLNKKINKNEWENK